MRSLIGQAYPDCGRKLLNNVELYKDPVDYKTLEEDIDIDIEKDMIITIAEDMFSALDFVLEGEAHDILQNRHGMEEGNGLEVWRRLKRRFDRQTRSKTMSDLGQVLNPEVAKSIAEVPKEIEKWEEKVHRLRSRGDNNITEDMMTAIVSRICPKRLKDYIDLHCNIDDSKSYVQVKDEVLRVVESVVLGKVANAKDEDDKGPKPMEVDPLLGAEWGWEENEHYNPLNYMKGKGKGGKGPMNFGKGGYSPWYQNTYKGNSEKGKGKGSFKGKGYKGGYKGEEKGQGKGGGKASSSTEFPGYCSYCGEWGHTQHYCAVRDRDWNQKGTNNLENEESQSEENQEEQPAEYGDLGGLGLFSMKKEIAGGCMRTWTPSSKTKCCNRYHALRAIEEEDEEENGDYHPLFHLPAEMGKSMVKVEVVADSGAADCVLPTSMLPEIPVKDAAVVNYKAASGKVLSSRGAKVLYGEAGGTKKKMEFQVADIHKPLASLRKIVRKGHRVVLDDSEPGGGYIMNKETGDKVGLRVQNEVYVFDFWVDVEASSSATSPTAGF